MCITQRYMIGSEDGTENREKQYIGVELASHAVVFRGARVTLGVGV